MHEIETLEELAVRTKGFIDLERANAEVELFASASQRVNVEPRCEGKKEKKDRREREKPQSEGPRLNPREVPEYFTPLNRQISAILVEMERRSLARPPMPRKNGHTMGKDAESYCSYHKAKGHKTDDCRVLKRDIEKLIQRGMLKEFVAGRERSRTPPRRARSPVNQEQSGPSQGKRVINLITGGFGAGGEGSHAREVYATQISTAA